MTITHPGGREPVLFNLTFEQPALLATLVVVPLGILAYLWFERRRLAVARRFASPEMQSNLLERPPRWRRHVPPILYGLALAGLCIASARPFLLSVDRRQHATVILLIDASNSMLARDVQPTRLAAAQLASETFLERVPTGFRVGVESFSRTVDLLNTPTIDRQNLRTALESLSAGPGTAIGDALASSLNLLSNTGPGGKDVILLTDGNNTAGSVDPMAAAHTAAARGVPVFTVAVGTTSAPPGSGVVAAAPDRALLGQIAAATGGATYSASSSSQLSDIYGRLGGTVVLQRSKREVTWMFIAAGALLAVLGAVLAGLWLRRIP